MNAAWLYGQYDHDFAENPAHPEWGVWFKLDKTRRLLDAAAELQCEVLRTWILEGCEGLSFDADGYVKSLSSTLIRNLETYFSECEERGLWLYPCLTTYWPKQWPSPVVNRRAREAYITNAVRPLAKLFRSRKNTLAIDIFNEIESEVVDKKKPASHRASIEDARSFLRENAQAIHAAAPGLLVSAGSGWRGFDSIKEGLYNGLGLDFLDVHVYADKPSLPDAAQLTGGVPIIIGEFGQSTQQWDDGIQDGALRGAYAEAVRKGYAGVFPWQMDFPGCTVWATFFSKQGGFRPAALAAKGLNASYSERFGGAARFTAYVKTASRNKRAPRRSR